MLLCVILLGALTAVAEQPYEVQFKDRAKMLIRHVAYHYPRTRPGYPPGWDGKLGDFGKYHYPMFIAQLADRDTSVHRRDAFRQRMNLFSTLPTFHFNLVGGARLLCMFPTHELVKPYMEAMLDRVWERDDSYNAFTAEGTENHISMSKTSAYLYAQLAARYYPQKFRDAPQRMVQMKKWIMDWSRNLYQKGTGEFNSAIYQAYNVAGWLNLYDFAGDREVKLAARAVLDYFAVEAALHYVQGMTGGADLRGQNCTRSFQGSYAYLAWLWYGDSPVALTDTSLDGGRNNNEVIQSVHAATSSYRPPMHAVQLCRNKWLRPGMYYGSKPDYLMEQQGYIRHSLYTAGSYMLGAGYFPYGGWGSGNNQVVSWKLIARVAEGSASAQFISGVGGVDPFVKAYAGANKRSPYDQLIHHRNVLVQMTLTPGNVSEQRAMMKQIFDQWRERWAMDFARRFPSDTIKLKHNPVYLSDADISTNRSSICISTAGTYREIFRENILFVELDQVFLAIRSIRGDQPPSTRLAEGGEMRFTSVGANPGKICGFVVEVVNKKDHSDLLSFSKAVLLQTQLDATLLDTELRFSYRSLEGELIEGRYISEGTFSEPVYDFGYGVYEPTLILHGAGFQQPLWPYGSGHGRVAQWKVNGIETDKEGHRFIYKGQGISVGEGKMILEDSRKKNYIVDYTGSVPRFK